MTAVDQRPPIKNPIREKRGTPEAPFADVAGFKAMLIEELQADSSAMLLDPHFVLPRGLSILSPAKGLIVTLEDFALPGRRRRAPLGRDRRLVCREDQARGRRRGEGAGLVQAGFRSRRPAGAAGFHRPHRRCVPALRHSVPVRTARLPAAGRERTRPPSTSRWPTRRPTSCWRASALSPTPATGSTSSSSRARCRRRVVPGDGHPDPAGRAEGFRRDGPPGRPALGHAVGRGGDGGVPRHPVPRLCGGRLGLPRRTGDLGGALHALPRLGRHPAACATRACPTCAASTR